MDKETIQKVKNILRNHEEIFFPVKKLYSNLLVCGELPSIEELVVELRSQPDLVVTANFPTKDESDPVVMLKERIPALDTIIDSVRSNIGSTLENLGQAYATGVSEMTPEEEDLLIEAMRRTKRLQAEMERMFADAGRKPGTTDGTRAE